jgi:fatty acid desaturase
VSLGRLPEHEQHILDEIERSLRRDRLARCAPRGRTVALLTLAAVALMVTGLVTSAPWAIWTFAVVWPVVVFLGFRLLSRWSGDGGPPDGR